MTDREADAALKLIATMQEHIDFLKERNALQRETIMHQKEIIRILKQQSAGGVFVFHTQAAVI